MWCGVELQVVDVSPGERVSRVSREAPPGAEDRVSDHIDWWLSGWQKVTGFSTGSFGK